jgi:hypothetical protein
LKNFLIASAAALLISAGAQAASAYSPMPEVTAKAPVTAPAADGSYKVAQNRINNNRRGDRRRNRGRDAAIGLGVAGAIIGLGAAAAAAEARRDRGPRYCRRVERRCADDWGWETRRWFRCVERRGC